MERQIRINRAGKIYGCIFLGNKKDILKEKMFPKSLFTIREHCDKI